MNGIHIKTRTGGALFPMRGASTLMLVVLCCAILTLGALFFVWQRYQFVRLGFEVGALREREARLRVAIGPFSHPAASGHLAALGEASRRPGRPGPPAWLLAGSSSITGVDRTAPSATRRPELDSAS